MEVCCHESDNKTGWFFRVNGNVISWTCNRGPHFGFRNICLIGNRVFRKRLASAYLLLPEVVLHLKCDGTHAETRFHLSAKRTSPFKSAGTSVQSTTGSRGVRISDSNAGYTMFRGSVKGTGYPLHSPVSLSLPLPYVTVCHHISTGFFDKRIVVCGAVRLEFCPPFRIYDKRFLLGGVEDFSRHSFAQTGSRICLDSYLGVLPLRVKHVNHEVEHCYAQILNVLHFTSTPHCIVVVRRTSVILTL